MIELTRSEDTVFVGWLKIRLAEAGVEAWILDGYTATAYAGALAGVQYRVMVKDADLARSKQILAEAEVIATRDV